MNSNKNNGVKVLGVNSDTSVCECCGKSNLKKVVVLQLANGEVVRYGRDCAAKKLGRSIKGEIDTVITIQDFISKWAGQFTAEQIAVGIGNKFGFPTTVKGNVYDVGRVGIFNHPTP
jgi:hypothetical protein